MKHSDIVQKGKKRCGLYFGQDFHPPNKVGNYILLGYNFGYSRLYVIQTYDPIEQSKTAKAQYYSFNGSDSFILPVQDFRSSNKAREITGCCNQMVKDINYIKIHVNEEKKKEQQKKQKPKPEEQSKKHDIQQEVGNKIEIHSQILIAGFTTTRIYELKDSLWFGGLKSTIVDNLFNNYVYGSRVQKVTYVFAYRQSQTDLVPFQNYEINQNQTISLPELINIPDIKLFKSRAVTVKFTNEITVLYRHKSEKIKQLSFQDIIFSIQSQVDAASSDLLRVCSNKEPVSEILLYFNPFDRTKLLDKSNKSGISHNTLSDTVIDKMLVMPGAHVHYYIFLEQSTMVNFVMNHIISKQGINMFRFYKPELFAFVSKDGIKAMNILSESFERDLRQLLLLEPATQIVNDDYKLKGLPLKKMMKLVEEKADSKGIIGKKHRHDIIIIMNQFQKFEQQFNGLQFLREKHQQILNQSRLHLVKLQYLDAKEYFKIQNLSQKSLNQSKQEMKLLKQAIRQHYMPCDQVSLKLDKLIINKWVQQWKSTLDRYRMPFFAYTKKAQYQKKPLKDFEEQLQNFQMLQYDGLLRLQICLSQISAPQTSVKLQYFNAFTQKDQVVIFKQSKKQKQKEKQQKYWDQQNEASFMAVKQMLELKKIKLVNLIKNCQKHQRKRHALTLKNNVQYVAQYFNVFINGLLGFQQKLKRKSQVPQVREIKLLQTIQEQIILPQNKLQQFKTAQTTIQNKDDNKLNNLDKITPFSFHFFSMKQEFKKTSCIAIKFIDQQALGKYAAYFEKGTCFDRLPLPLKQYRLDESEYSHQRFFQKMCRLDLLCDRQHKPCANRFILTCLYYKVALKILQSTQFASDKLIKQIKQQINNFLRCFGNQMIAKSKGQYVWVKEYFAKLQIQKQEKADKGTTGTGGTTN